MQDESINTIFNTAWEVVNNTGRNVFLTGKAGTGKTTFLKKLMKETSKNCVVVAPTGVAAINAGGVTMHSFFQLPFNAYLRHGGYVQEEVQFTNKSELLRGLRISKPKRELMSEMDLLIIDEVSMVRADLLDAVDDILRSVRGNRNKPFGGVQVLFIGDLFQLPPVVQDQEKGLLSKYYESPFFFNAEVLKENPPLIIELKKIYRQTEETFIGLLNNIRNNTMKEMDYEVLHSRYVPSFRIDEENIITLTTHNNTADRINQEELRKLKSPSIKFTADIDGDFNDKALPTERVLELKLGAQIMFIKNDTKGGGRYYNGKLAKIIKLTAEDIIVKLADSDIELKVEKEKWENIKYVFNKEDNKINEEPLGSFLQYPIRLAWAITIHKSQGLTFTKMAIDAGASFAAGQVYVALSRCTSLTGLTLLTKIPASAISTDPRIVEFIKKETDLNSLNLDEEKFEYSISRLEKIFDWNVVNVLIEEAIEFTNGKEFDGRDSIIEKLNAIKTKVSEQTLIAMKFMDRVNQIVIVKPIDTALLTERVKEAKKYFIGKLHSEVLHSIEIIREEVKIKKRTKTLLLYYNELILDLWRKIRLIEKANVEGLDVKISFNVTGGDIPKPIEQKMEASSEPNIGKAYNVEEIRKTTANAYAPWTNVDDERLIKLVAVNTPISQLTTIFERGKGAIESRITKLKLENRIIESKASVVSSKKISLELYKEKKTIEEIATLRGMAASTIEGHLALFIKSGEVNLFDFITEEQFQIIKVAIEKMGFENLTDLKRTTGDSISWGQLRMAVNYIKEL